MPSESTAETRSSTEPVGVSAIDDLVAHTKPIAPSDLDWDAFRRECVNMSKDDRTAIHEYAERWHQYNNAPPGSDLPAPQIPGHLHALFTDLSAAYATALGGREDVLYKTDMARAMARAASKKRSQTPEPNGKAPVQAGPTSKQLAALEAIALGHIDSVSPSMYRKLVSLGLVTGTANGAELTEAGKAALPRTVESAGFVEGGPANGGEVIEAAPAGLPAAEESMVDQMDRENDNIVRYGTKESPRIPQNEVDYVPLTVAKGLDPDADADPTLTDGWMSEQLRTAGEEPVAPIKAE